MAIDRRQVDTLVTTLRTLPDGARDAALRSACGDDPGLAEAVRAGLAEAGGATLLTDGGLPAAIPLAPDRWLGRRLGAWRIEGLLGRGGMGMVYLAARDDGAYQQRAALKLMQAGGDEAHLRARFHAERQILARLEHPHIARLLDGGVEADSGVPWLVLEYVEGVDLMAWCQSHRLGVDERLQLFLDVCAAVEHAHRQLVVHRDLKPSNILVDATGQVKLLDFGIAKLLADEGAVQTQMRMFTPAYAAPEQLRGEPATTGVDVYALGLLLYELLTGRQPYAGPDTTPHEQQRAILERDPTRPSRAVLAAGSTCDYTATHGSDARALARRLGGDLDAIVARAMRKDPVQRYASVAELADDVRRHLAREPVRAHRGGLRYRLGRFLERHALASAFAGLALLGLLAGLGLALWQAGEARAAAARESAERARAEATRDFVVKAFTGLNPTQSVSGVQLSLRDFVNQNLARLDQELADPAARAELRLTLATALRDLGAPAEAAPALEQAERELAAAFGPVSARVAEALHHRGMTAAALGNRAQQAELARRAVAMLEQVPDVDPLKLIAARSSLARVANEAGRHREALAQTLAIRDERVRLLGVEDSRSAVDYNNLCSTRWYLGDYAAAEADCRRGSELLATDPAAPRSRMSFLGNVLGLVQLAQGRYAEADGTFDEAIAIARVHLGERHPHVATLLVNKARVRLDSGDPAATLALLDEAETIQASTGSKSTTGPSLAIRAAALKALGRLAEAEAQLRELLAAESAAGNSTVPSQPALRARRQLAEILIARGADAEAGPLLDAVEAALRERELTTHEDYGWLLRARARLLAARGEEAAAAELDAQGRALLVAALGAGHPALRPR